MGSMSLNVNFVRKICEQLPTTSCVCLPIETADVTENRSTMSAFKEQPFGKNKSISILAEKTY